LRDYERLGKGRIKIVEKHPDVNEADSATATQDGIQEVQFNTLSNNAFAVQGGYVGLSLQYLDKKESIPFIQSTGDLEYQLTRLIRKMTVKNLPPLSLYTQSEDAYTGQGVAINALKEILADQYDLRDLTLDQPEASITGKALMVYGLNKPLGATASGKIKDFSAKGGNVLLMLDNHTINSQIGTAPSYNVGIEDMLANDFGITVNQDIVYDIRLNEIITLQAGNRQYLIPYPFWLKALPGKSKTLPVENIGSVTLAWPNSFTLTAKEGINQETLLLTSKNSGSQSGTFQIAPDKFKEGDFETDGSEKILAVFASNNKSKVIVVGDSDFATDQFVQNAGSNLSFANLLIDTVAADDVMATVTQKSGDNPVFVFASASQAQIIQLLNLIGISVAIGVFGGWWLWKRKKGYRRTYRG